MSATVAPRLILQTRQRPLEHTLGHLGIAPGLNRYVEYDAILIDGAPEVMLHAQDADEDFIHVPLVASPGPGPL
nr:hypothetical protein [Acidisphaera sp. S103]